MPGGIGYTSIQLGYALRFHQCTAPYFGDIVPADAIPAPQSYPIFYIVNTEIEQGVIGHWILLIMTAPGAIIEYFDPLAKNPAEHSVHIDNYLKVHSGPDYIKNTVKYQSSDSFNCGLFCAFVADKRSQGKSFAQTMRYFNSDDLSMNDVMVESYYKRHIRSRALKATFKSVDGVKLHSFDI